MIEGAHTGLVIDSTDGPIFLISDIHAGALQPTVDEDSRQMLEELLLLVNRAGGRLLILGDLFDYWQESGHRTPLQLQPWLDIFDHFRNTAKPTILLTGNHDHWAGYALIQRSFIVVHDHILATTSDKPWLFLHGDGLPADELILTRKGLNKRFRNPFYNVLFKTLPFELRVGLMRAFSNYRKQRGLDRTENQLIDHHLSDWLQHHDFLGVVYGHTHEKSLRNEGGKLLANTGTFSSDGTVVIIDDTTLTMTTVDELKSTVSAKMTYIMPDGTRR